MKFEVFITSKAEFELSEAFRWYANINLELANRFLSDFKEELNLVAQNPRHYQIRYDEIRLFHLKKFPYSIHFEFNGDAVNVIAIFHQRQNMTSLNID